MKVSDLTQIPDASTRLIQAQKFLVSLKETEEAAARIRDEALLEARNELSQYDVAFFLGVSQQRVSHMEKRARLRYSNDD